MKQIYRLLAEGLRIAGALVLFTGWFFLIGWSVV